MPDDLTIQESLLNDSRISSSGNGNESDKPFCTQPTGGQKWWAATLIGFVFAIISSPIAYEVSSYVTQNTVGFKTMYGEGPVLSGLLIHTVIFILIIRLILW
jgi:hypothetical protein